MSESAIINRLSWSEVSALDRRLRDLEALVKQQQLIHQHDPEYCANFVWFRLFKPTLTQIVGHWREEREKRNDEARASMKIISFETEEARQRRIRLLSSSAAYDATYRHLYELLPYCKHEGMCGNRSRATPGNQ